MPHAENPMPLATATIVAARIAAFMPGESPPLVRIAMIFDNAPRRRGTVISRWGQGRQAGFELRTEPKRAAAPFARFQLG
jgi:hypothetical protein